MFLVKFHFHQVKVEFNKAVINFDVEEVFNFNLR